MKISTFGSCSGLLGCRGLIWLGKWANGEFGRLYGPLDAGLVGACITWDCNEVCRIIACRACIGRCSCFSWYFYNTCLKRPVMLALQVRLHWIIFPLNLVPKKNSRYSFDLGSEQHGPLHHSAYKEIVQKQKEKSHDS